MQPRAVKAHLATHTRTHIRTRALSEWFANGLRQRPPPTLRWAGQGGAPRARWCPKGKVVPQGQGQRTSRLVRGQASQPFVLSCTQNQHGARFWVFRQPALCPLHHTSDHRCRRSMTKGSTAHDKTSECVCAALHSPRARVPCRVGGRGRLSKGATAAAAARANTARANAANLVGVPTDGVPPA